MPAPIHLKCAHCGIVIVCDESILDTRSSACSGCGALIPVHLYPPLAKLIEQREAKARALKAATQEAKRQELLENIRLAEESALQAKEDARLANERAIIEARAQAQFRASEQEASRAVRRKLSDSMHSLPITKNPQVIGMIGSSLLSIGVFLPIIKVPIVGDVNYFMNGKGDGTIILVLAFASILLSLSSRFQLLFVTGIGSLGVTAFSFFHVLNTLGDAKRNMSRELAGNPFRGVGEAMADSIQFQWGWPVLALGGILVICAAAIAKSAIRDIGEQHG